MTTSTIPQTVLFPDLFDKPLVATFDRRHASSDGGTVLLKAAEPVYGLVAGFARCLVDRREPGKIRHTLAEVLGQRIFGITCGHPVSPESCRTILRKAAFASRVVASIPMVVPFTRSAVASTCRIQVNTALCVSRSIKRRVREIVEGSGGGSRCPCPILTSTHGHAGHTTRVDPFWRMIYSDSLLTTAC